MKRFLWNVLLFCAMGVVLLCPYYMKQLYSFSELRTLKEALRSDKSVILFGSSVNKHCAPTDTDRRSIAEMLDSYTPDQSVAGVSHSAYQADIFLEYVRYIAKSGKKPVLIIPINLRSFSPEWDLRPSYQFAEEKYLLNGYPFLVNLKYREIQPSEFKNYPVYYGKECVGKVKDYDYKSAKELDGVSETRRGYIFHYMQPLMADHRKLKSLADICEIGKRNGLKIVMYITPIDYLHAEQVEIRGFREHQNANIRTIKSALASYDIELIDLSMALGTSSFHYKKRPNEHLNMVGRRQVAQAIVARSGIIGGGGRPSFDL